MSVAAASSAIALLRQSGFLNPDQALAVVSELTKPVGPAPELRLALAAGLLRQTAVFNPFDAETATLAHRLCEAAAPAPRFGQWLGETASARPRPDLAQRLAEALQAWLSGQAEGFMDRALALARDPDGRAAAPLLAFGFLASGAKDAARALLDGAPKNFMTHNLLARLALEEDDAAACREHLQLSLAFEPAQPSAALQLAGLSAGLPGPGLLKGKRIHLCLYSWNKRDSLLATLAHLRPDDLGGTRVTLLNNGSDFPAEELEGMACSAAPGLNLDVLHLPVNIGAPAARNWLLSLPASAEADYVAFLDDDALPCPGWLARLVQTLDGHEGAVAAGAKILGPRRPRTVQYAWRFFAEAGPDRIRFTANAPTLLDLGQYDMVRPCLTVMGCCHVFHMGRWRKLGLPGFDIRFSPSQVDDIEHDLQIWRQGGQVLFDGRVQVQHMQDTGDPARRTPAALAQAWANHHKMERKFSAQELAAVAQAVDRADAAHWHAALGAAGSPVPEEIRRLLGGLAAFPA